MKTKCMLWMMSVAILLLVLTSGCNGTSGSDGGGSGGSGSSAFKVSSTTISDGGIMPQEYSCDGDGVSPPISWSGAPIGTQSYAVVMHHEAAPDDIHTYLILYNIPAGVSHLDAGATGIGAFGANTVNGLNEYSPPCSQGPGDKSYTITVYALSGLPDISVEAEVDRETILAAIAPITLDSDSITFTYARNGDGGGGGGEPQFNIEQSISDGAQRTTIAFSGLAMMTGNLEAQSFFPPGKVADYTGFQYLRDNDPDGMGHNTSFLTRIAYNVIYILNDTQFTKLKALAVAQQADIDAYGYNRYPLMKAFRRLMDGDIPSGATGLNLNSVKAASRELYLIDGQISFDRALLYAEILKSLDDTQKAYLEAMKGNGFNSWPDITSDQVRTRMQSLPQGTAVAVMTYAGDLFSWYAGSVEADVYFCPERHGTYYGGFYIKDAPAIGHEGYSINEQLTATAGSALSDSSKGYVTDAQANLMSSLVNTQRNNLYAAGASNIVDIRTEIATLLRSLLETGADANAVEAQVLDLSGEYGELDGENNYNYATVFAQVYATLTVDQKTALMELRQSIMSGEYSDGTPFDFTNCTTPFLYSAVITDEGQLAPYIDDTDYLFFEP